MERSRLMDSALRFSARSRYLLAASLVAVLAGIVFAFHTGAARSPANAPLPVIADLGGDFELARAGGAMTRLQDYRGKIVLLFFGYTHCPDVCPTTLQTLRLAMDELGVASERAQVIMVSVDPERDTPELLERYVRYFDPRFVGLSGTTERIDEVARKYRVHRRKTPSAGGGYSVSHSPYIYLLDRHGRTRALFGDATRQAEIADGVRQLLADPVASR
jgi:protein SCO1